MPSPFPFDPDTDTDPDALRRLMRPLRFLVTNACIQTTTT